MTQLISVSFCSNRGLYYPGGHYFFRDIVLEPDIGKTALAVVECSEWL